MIRCVIDASVAIKWFMPLQADEQNFEEALQILNLIASGEASCHQPPHFTAEVMGVLTRLRPKKAAANLLDLLNMDFKTIETTTVYATACELSIQLNHHLFDTLYHAVALNTASSIFITADDTYYRKAQKIGQIMRLADFTDGA